MTKPTPDPFDALDPLDSSETSDPPVFPEGTEHPTPAQGEVTPEAGPEEERARGAQGRYGLPEEPVENAEPAPQAPKTVDQQARDRQRDRVVRATGEDKG